MWLRYYMLDGRSTESTTSRDTRFLDQCKSASTSAFANLDCPVFFDLHADLAQVVEIAQSVQVGKEAPLPIISPQ